MGRKYKAEKQRYRFEITRNGQRTVESFGEWGKARAWRKFRARQSELKPGSTIVFFQRGEKQGNGRYSWKKLVSGGKDPAYELRLRQKSFLD